MFVYLDTSIPSLLIRERITEPEIIQMQEVTHRLWSDSRFDFVISQRVIDEIQAGTRHDQVLLRLQVMEKLGRLEITEEVEALANLLLKERALPLDQESDAIHVAVVTVNGVPYPYHIEFEASCKQKPAITVRTGLSSSRVFSCKNSHPHATIRGRTVNEIIEEVREAKRKVNARFDNDIHKYCVDVMCRQEELKKQDIQFLRLNTQFISNQQKVDASLEKEKQ